MTDIDDVARRAARDVAHLLDRRGLRELVALARRVAAEARQPPAALFLAQVNGTEGTGCTLRQRDWSARRRTAARTTDDRYPT